MAARLKIGEAANITGGKSHVGIFKWRGRVSRKDFRRRFMEAVVGKAPAFRCEEAESEELDFRIEGAAKYKEVTVSLHRAYAEFEKDPGKYDDILAHWLRSIEHLWLPPKPIERGNIVPMIKERSWLAAQMAPGQAIPAREAADSFWTDDYNEEVLVAYAVHDNRFTYPPRSDFLAAGVHPEQMRELALENLRARTPNREIRSIHGVWMISAGGNFEASLLLDENLWSDPRFSKAPILLLAVPERDGIFACTDESPSVVWNIASLASHGVRTQPYPITSRLFKRAADRFEILDPDDHDDAHPIPALDVIDIEAKGNDGTSRFVIVIATPLAKDPRSVFRLFRKMDGYLGHIEGTQPKGSKSEIEINIHRDSDIAIFALLATLPDFVASRGARLIVERSK